MTFEAKRNGGYYYLEDIEILSRGLDDMIFCMHHNKGNTSLKGWYLKGVEHNPGYYHSSWSTNFDTVVPYDSLENSEKEVINDILKEHFAYYERSEVCKALGIKFEPLDIYVDGAIIDIAEYLMFDATNLERVEYNEKKIILLFDDNNHFTLPNVKEIKDALRTSFINAKKPGNNKKTYIN